jgi:hypothetical protein
MLKSGCFSLFRSHPGGFVGSRWRAGFEHPERALFLSAAGAAAFAGRPAEICGAPLLIGISSCVEPIATGYINRRIGSERRATVLSIASMFRSLVLAALAPGLGYATDQWPGITIGGISQRARLGIPLLLRAGALVVAEPVVEGSPRVSAAHGQIDACRELGLVCVGRRRN